MYLAKHSGKARAGLGLLLSTFIASLFLLSLTPPLAQAADNNVKHSSFTQVFSFTQVLTPDDPRFSCISGATENTVNATGEFDVTEFTSGPNVGRMHLVVDFTGTFQIKAAAGIYVGTFKQHIVDNIDNNLYTFKTFVHNLGTAPDGSELKFSFQAQLRIVDGVAKLDFLKSTCIH